MKDYKLSISATNRVKYIDALRGFAMLLVVFVHVEIFSIYGFGNATTLANIISAVHMPLFFFISGFCVYKLGRKYTITKVCADALRLILPAVVVGAVYTNFKTGMDLMYFFSNPMKAGYWFTITMFEVLLIYYVINNVMHNSRRRFLVTLWVISIVLYMMKLPLKIFPIADTVGNYLCLHQTCNFFVFFVVGVTASMFMNYFHTIISRKFFPTIIAVLLLACSYVQYGPLSVYWGTSVIWMVIETIGESLIGVTGTITLYMVFYKYKEFFSGVNSISRGLICIGVNTLPIYLLHYFFLSKFPLLGELLLPYPNVILEFIVVLPITVIIIIASLLSNYIFSASPIFSWMLGNRRLSKHIPSK